MTPHIVVLGAGYSGLLAAKLVAGRTDAKVTLVNAGDRFVERVRLHQLATGQQLRDLPLRDLVVPSRLPLPAANLPPARHRGPGERPRDRGPRRRSGAGRR
jgi:choline dehydrogenase-like flavoprotein